MEDEASELLLKINRELEQMGYHLRLGKIYFPNADEYGFEFVPPIDQWFNELPEVDSLVNTRIKEWLSKRHDDTS